MDISLPPVNFREKTRKMLGRVRKNFHAFSPENWGFYGIGPNRKRPNPLSDRFRLTSLISMDKYIYRHDKQMEINC
jgi:hypothetical protein